ncbi:V/A-type H+-transporting ATPase subunit C [Caloramator quimbayensis]|uniref:V/A-type H+-transporting ATPase subunit C n=1 Tax=Caloramator quimbayensis TaxID=1147123 RepID=A0A1T4XMV0_9CLOT|nr:V-type ATPase subunit [Caloramator quimbayensis]SKA90488.1 V/A-type H+-transporting ATPase subunit C [Caloramator quimbayensis]
MNNVVKFSAVNTKIQSMSGKLLKEEDYKKIIALKSTREIAAYLRDNTFYGEFFKDIDLSDIHRDELERHLKQGLISHMDKLIHYFNGNYRSFFKCFYMKYEIYDLKKAARMIHIDKSYSNLRENLVFAGKYRYIDVEAIIKAKSIAEIIYALKDTVYEPFLKNLIDGNEKESLFRFEMALDRAFFSVMEENVKKLDKRDQSAFFELYGSYIDMLNLQWIYRGKKYYNLTPEELFNYTINRGLKFNYVKIKEFCYSNNIQDFINKTKDTPYSFMFKENETQEIFMERRMNRYMYFKTKYAKQRFKLDLSVVIAYMDLIEFEIKDIISMIENVRYGMNFEETKKYLIKAI